MSLRSAFDAFEGDTWKQATVPDQAQAIVTRRLIDLEAPTAEGSDLADCAFCDALVYLSPATVAVFKGRQLPPVWCAQCALDVVRRGGTA